MVASTKLRALNIPARFSEPLVREVIDLTTESESRADELFAFIENTCSDSTWQSVLGAMFADQRCTLAEFGELSLCFGGYTWPAK